VAKTSKSDEVRPIIVKKIKKVAGGHHGGAWKVAYADFVTAMMAFFLLLWLLNVTTDEAKDTIANYFDPSRQIVSDTQSGAGGVMGGTSIATDGAMTSTMQDMSAPKPTGQAGDADSNAEQDTAEKLEAQLRQQEDAQFEEAKEGLEKQLTQNAELAALAKNMMIDITPEGMRIQLVDQQGKPLFPSGSAEMYDYTKTLLKAVATAVSPMTNDISVRGHTDAHKYSPNAKYTNWELSADRANASRRILLQDGIAEKKISDVSGRADKEPLIPENPLDERNRRITVIVLRESVEDAARRGAFGATGKLIRKSTPKPLPAVNYQKTPGEVYFP